MKSPLLIVVFLCLSAQCFAQSYSSPDALVELIPDDVRLKQGSKWIVVAFPQATTAITSKALDHEATFKLKVDSLGLTTGRGSAFLVRCSGRTSAKTSAIPFQVWAYFEADQAESLKGVRNGQTITITGNIVKASMEAVGNGPLFIVDLTKCKVARGASQ